MSTITLVITIKQGPLLFVARKQIEMQGHGLGIEVIVSTPKDGLNLYTKTNSSTGDCLYCESIELPDWVNLKDLMPFLIQKGWEPHQDSR